MLTVLGPIIGWGPAGAIIIVMGWAIYKLYNRNQELNAALTQTAVESIKSNVAIGQSMDKVAVAVTALTAEVTSQRSEIARLTDLLYRRGESAR